MTIQRSAIYIALLFICFTTAYLPADSNQSVTETGPSIDSLIQNTSLKEKIGQLFFVPIHGRFMPREDHSYKEIEDLIVRDKIGGLIFMQGDVYGQAVLTNKLQALSEIPLWITQDMEYGAAMRIEGTTRFTPAMGVAATGNKRNAYVMGKITAKEAKALGVHQMYAPVLDVNNNPDNPVINVRSFSGTPEMVADFGIAFMQGASSEGVISTAKHFPGHGDTGTDSHLALPVSENDYARLDSVELVPFRAAIGMGIPSIMSAHISFPKISPHPEIPGTLDPAILGSILMDSLQFKGMVVTDGLNMHGITKTFSPGRAVVRALHAGADIMLISIDIHTAINEVMAAVERGEITEERIDQSYQKILLWKQQAGLFESDNQIDLNQLDQQISTNTFQAEANRIARESITVLKNEGSILPINPLEYKNILVLSVADDESGNTGSTFVRTIRDYHPNVTYEVFDKRSNENDAQEIIRKTQSADLVIIGSFITLRSGQSISLQGKHKRLLDRVMSLKKKTVLAMFGNPYLVKELAKTDVHVMGWANTSLQMKALAPALFGASDVSGTLPIEIPGLYSVGDGIHLEKSSLRYGKPEDVGLSSVKLYEIEDILRDAVLDSTFPGAVAAVVKDGVLVYKHAEGYHTYDKLRETKDSDVFDLASITKVLSTTTATMKLIDEGKLRLDDRVSMFLPEFDTDEKHEITIRQLLLHESGLPPFRVYIDSLQNRSSIIKAIKNEPLINAPGEKYVYSDLGMILLADIVETISGKTIDALMRAEFYYPMGMNSTWFNPRKVSRWYVDRIPPTEIDTVYRHQLIQAEVNDERAWYMDGVAGHAGLFSTVDDLAKFGTMLLNNGSYNGVQYLQPETIRSFTSKQSELSGRGLGFDRKSPTGFTTAGQLASVDTFGHLGFTGTSFWIDREKKMIVILLTNRTYPNRSYGKNISRIRVAVADAAFSSLLND